MRVHYFAPFAQRTGFAQAAHDYMLALHRAGVELEIFPIVDCDLDDLDERYDELIPLATEHSGKPPTHKIVHTVPRAVPMFLPSEPTDYVRIAITTWETTHAPKDIIDGLGGSCDMVIVPSEFCAEAFTPELCSKIEVVPHCFDPHHWPYLGSMAEELPYAFYSVLGWNERKNPIGLLKAYMSEFSINDDVVLRLKLSGCNEEDILALMQASGIDHLELPALEIITEYMDHDDMVDFHFSNHCFVTAARGEGWNLPLFEAALCGRQLISTAFGGQVDYLSRCPGQAFGVNYSRTPAIAPPVVEAPVEIGGLKVRPVTTTAPSGITVRQHWAEPDLYELQKLMRAQYVAAMTLLDSLPEDRHRMIGGDFSARAALEESYSCVTVGKQLASILEGTLDDKARATG